MESQRALATCVGLCRRLASTGVGFRGCKFGNCESTGFRVVSRLYELSLELECPKSLHAPLTKPF